MSSEEEVGYALWSWKRFEEKVTDELLRAITSAFALIAVADGDLAKSEDSEFMSTLAQCADLFNPLDLKFIDPLFQDLCGALFSDPQSGRSHALQEIKAVQGNPLYADLVRSATEIAMAADNRGVVKESELMGKICEALNLPVRQRWIKNPIRFAEVVELMRVISQKR
jgi:tellurite resistance protein